MGQGGNWGGGRGGPGESLAEVALLSISVRLPSSSRSLGFPTLCSSLVGSTRALGGLVSP